MLVGEVQRGYEIGKGTRWAYIWQACSVCGKERWVLIMRGSPISYRCKSCSRRGNKNAWQKGIIGFHGYRAVWLKPDDFFYSMVPIKSQTVTGGYVPHHRLVMAQHIGRLLHTWEIVHHKNGVKDDNQIENLQLVTDDRHTQITLLENKVKRLEIENAKLRESLNNACIASCLQ